MNMSDELVPVDEYSPAMARAKIRARKVRELRSVNKILEDARPGSLLYFKLQGRAYTLNRSLIG